MKYSIIPKPIKYDMREERVEISENTQIICFKDFSDVGDSLSEYLKTVANPQGNKIIISKAKSISDEGYAIYTENENVYIKASTVVGAFHAVITLKWILMQVKKINGKRIVDGFLIEDKPLYKHRGVMLDECRHFFGKQTVMNLLYNMSMLKMNVFHWHLSDDQGFRIESKQFPLLNEISSVREHKMLRGLGQKNSGGKYGPFYYSQEEIKEIVSYAHSLHISVIPEIDIPGHCTAILAAYPEYGCTGEKQTVAVTNGVLENILCAGNEKTYDFLEKLFGEVCPLFNSKYFHIGGDEARYKHWKKCPKCRSVMKENDLKNEKQLQVLFMNKVNDILKGYGKYCIAWNDCVSSELDNTIACHYWNGMNKGIIKKQAFERDIILSPMMNFYLDFKNSRIPTEKVYSFNEKKSGFGKNGMKIKGVEAELWTEWIASPKGVEFSLYPRLAAVAEVAWTRYERRNIKNFRYRMRFYEMYLRSRNVNYYRLHHSRFRSAFSGTYSFGESGKEYKNNEQFKLKKAK